jgi:uncharacterized protein (TIGR03000 family)
MYSVVLMAALTAGQSTPAWGCHGRGGCCGCTGYISSCTGCWGSCHGGWGGCHGWRHGCHGCHGGYYGGCCGGCYGGCYGGYSYGCHGCYGGCYGCCGGWGGSNYAPMVVPPGTAPAPAPEPVPAPKKVGELPGQTDKAQLVVELPAEAKLYVDDHLMNTASKRRVFNTPTLKPGQTYYYIVRAELSRNGQTYSSSRRVIIRPGEIIQASFSDLDLMAATPLKGQITAQR